MDTTALSRFPGVERTPTSAKITSPLATVSQYDKTRPILEDSNGNGGSTSLIDSNRVQDWLKWIDGETGRRSDVAHSYIHPARLDRSPNVHLLSGWIAGQLEWNML
ncbi:hypothetical protein GSI_09507 [Ganoderma sinense ZZ0214-1]|uniref:Uncharacterized protein n=1 Tax=Ganoderma sinense ZZ0214-1 TaxID=1077348 RepID=A0A2G8S3K8_9APHY|nr:hypothetical protein GSI_09507 [Ganoderma sinense ZZ0214-1]